MGCFVISRAVFVRVLFALHGLMAIWRLFLVTSDALYWLIALALVGLLIEATITIWKKKGNEWKWFCPSVFFYLLCVVPAIWFLELYELEKRIALKAAYNVTNPQTGTNASVAEELTANFPLGWQLRIPVKLTSDQWVRTLEQLLLLLLILGRWMLPKGKLTHDQLSQLLLVYIGTAADIVEFFDAFKEDEVRYNKILCIVILSIWSWSLLQFTMVLTATKARKDQSGLLPNAFAGDDESCCTPDVYGIVISIFLQDAPFLVLRLLLIFKYKVVSYTNMFFTCKNTLVIALLCYRLIVVQWERKRERKRTSEYMTMSESNSRMKLMVHSNSDPWHGYKTKHKVNLREPEEDPNEPPVNYIIKRHISTDDVSSIKPHPVPCDKPMGSTPSFADVTARLGDINQGLDSDHFSGEDNADGDNESVYDNDYGEDHTIV